MTDLRYALGAAIGLVGAFVLTRWMSSLLFGVTASDPATYVTVLLVSLGAALLACSIPRAPDDESGSAGCTTV